MPFPRRLLAAAAAPLLACSDATPVADPELAAAQARLQNAPSAAVDAGALDLALARPAMPAERPYDHVTYRTAGVALAGGTRRAAVTATLTNAGSALRRYPRDCVVRLVAYRDRARRDEAPRSGAPDWEQTLAGCAAGEQELVLHAGAPRQFETTAAAARLASGRWYFAVYVRAPGRRVFLSAGDAAVAR